MSEPIIAIDSSEVRAGNLEKLRRAIGDLARFVEENEPRPIAYNLYLSQDGTRMTVVQVHPDSASMEDHMRLAGPAFRQFVELISLKTTEVYGRPSDELADMLRRKAGMLGTASLAVHDRSAGFFRLGLDSS